MVVKIAYGLVLLRGGSTKRAHSPSVRNEISSVKYAPMAPASVDTSLRYVIDDILELNHYEHCGAGCRSLVVEMYQVWFEQRMESSLE